MPIFVSYAIPDEPWAQWMALELQAAGHEVHLRPAGADFADRMAFALSDIGPVLLLLSAEHHGTDADWARILTPVPPADRLTVLCLDSADPPPALRALTCHSLHDLDEEDAVELLLRLVGGRALTRKSGKPVIED